MHYIPVCYSSKPASNIPVIVPFVFQYCHPLLNSSILLTVSPIPFSFSNTPMFYFPNFYPVCFSASPFEIFIVSFQYSSLYYSRTRFMLRIFSFCFQVFHFHAAYLTSLTVSPLRLRRHLWDGTRNPLTGRPPCVVLALLACCHNFLYYQHSLTFSQLYNSQNSNS